MFTAFFRSKRHFAAAFCGLTLAAGIAAQEAPPKTILIGFSGSLSGISEVLGKSLANAADMALAEINRQNPKVAGQRVVYRLLRQDDRNDPQTAVSVAKQLLQEGVVAVIGTSSSGTAQAVARIYSDAGVALLSPAVSAAVLTEQGYGSFFRMIGHDGQAGANLADYVVRVMHLRRFAVIDNGSLYGTGVAETVYEQVRRSGADVLARERISYTSDFRQVVLRMRRLGAEVLFFGGGASQAVRLAQVIQQTGGGMRLMVASTGAVGATFLIIARSAANGVIAIEAGMPTADMPGWRRFEEEYNQRYGLELFGFTPFSYDAAQVIVAAIRQSGSTRPARIIETLRQISHKGLTGTVAFDAAGNPRNPLFTVYEVQGQRWVPLQSYAEQPVRKQATAQAGAGIP